MSTLLSVPRNYRPSKRLARSLKLDAVIAFLTERHLDAHGGYPLDHDDFTFARHVIVADLDDGKDRNRTLVCVYRKSDLVAWYDRAADFLRECPEEDWVTAMFETEQVEAM